MPSGPGGLDANGIWQYGEADNPDGTASGLLNKLAHSVSTAIGLILGRLTTLEKRGFRGSARGVGTGAAVTTLTTTAWTDIASVTATTKGLTCVVRWSAVLVNQGSGATRTQSMRVLLDGIAMTPTQLDYAITNPNAIAASYELDSVPAAGAHTWKLQSICATPSAVGVYNACIDITEG